MQEGRALRLLGQATMQHDEARRLLHEAATLFQGMEARVEVARTMLALALHPARRRDGTEEAVLTEAHAVLHLAGANSGLTLPGERPLPVVGAQPGP